MTNYLTRLVSMRQYDMHNEIHLMNEIKEACCYVTRDFNRDLERSWKGTLGEKRESYLTGGGIAKDYVLPDYHIIKKGFARDHDPEAAIKAKRIAAGKSTEPVEEILTLRNERFTVPELLFNPMDIGIRQPGLAETVMQSLSVLPVGLWPGLLANVVVVGGSANLDGFIHRLQADIMALAPSECLVRVARPQDPIVSTWRGAATLARDEDLLASMSVTKAQYDEYGSAWVARKFGGK
jgi:actin-related protein 6